MRGKNSANKANEAYKASLNHFRKNVIRNLVLQAKGLEGFFLEQCHGLALKVKPFKIFTAIHNSKIFDSQRRWGFQSMANFDCLHLVATEEP